MWETAPTPANDLLRYSTEGAWTYPYAIKLRKIHWWYTCAIAIPATAIAYPLALTVQHLAGLHAEREPRAEPLTGGSKVGQAVLDRVGQIPEPPALVDVWHEVQDDVATREGAGARLAWWIGAATTAVTALLYGIAWLVQRPGRLLTCTSIALAVQLT
ncbi:hypothetical protein [Frankia sp. R82]|uniref:hypothetical protein n=1 Tax=Frankia sp. R82 TaxID=2950553 RepID=UPI00204307D8|nr:hypothetical protein [Frankia sp. R82]MCM3884158.1 hypothetical protein [Frankia sp. R82]